MLDFDVVFYPNDPEVAVESIKQINFDVAELYNFDVFNPALRKQVYNVEPEKVKFFNKIWAGNYVSALALIDGLKSNSEDELLKIQEKTLKTFSEQELAKMFNIILNLAFAQQKLVETTYIENELQYVNFLHDFIPHRILYENLVNKKSSIFSKVVGDQLNSLLFNGAFWETAWMTYDVNYKGTDKNFDLIENILINDFNKLDAKNSKQGIQNVLNMVEAMSVYKNQKKNKWFRFGADFFEMNPLAVKNYISFVNDIYKKKVIQNKPEEVVAYLLLPALDYEFNDGFYDFTEDEEDKDYYFEFSLFTDDFFRHITKTSETMKQRLADYLLNDDLSGIDEDIYSVVENLPGISNVLMYAGENIIDMTRYSDNFNNYYFNQRFALKNDEKTNSYKYVYYPSHMETFKEKLN